MLLEKMNHGKENVFYDTNVSVGGKYKHPDICVYRGDSVVAEYDNGREELRGFLYSFRSYNSGSDGLFNMPKIYKNGREKLVSEYDVMIYPCRVVIFEKTIFEDKY